MKDRPFERFFWLSVGVLAGALGSAAVGAVFGLAFWVTGIGFAYDWLDWPIGGALFGLVVGAIGATIVRAVHAVGARGIQRLGVPPLAAVAVALSAVAGLMIGPALFSGNGIAQAALLGILGGLGSAIGGVIAGRIGR
jgi:hypothetical protein